MQDILLEPYGAEILKLSVGQTTALTAFFALGTLAGFGLAARTLGRNADPYRIAGFGAVAGVFAFAAVIFAAPLSSVLLFRIGTALIGFGGGLFAAGTLTAAMALARDGESGLALGTWGAVQATAAGGGIALGGGIRDAVSSLASSGALGRALTDPSTGYSVVYHIEIALLFATLVAIGPLVRTARTRFSQPSYKVRPRRISRLVNEREVSHAIRRLHGPGTGHALRFLDLLRLPDLLPSPRRQARGLSAGLHRARRRRGSRLPADARPRRTICCGPGTSRRCRTTRTIAATSRWRRLRVWPGAPLEPTGNPMLDGVGPGSYADREDVPELTMEDIPCIVPMRLAEGTYLEARDPDPRGMIVMGADSEVGGVVTDVWVDRAEALIRYLEVEVTTAWKVARRVLLPLPFAKIDRYRGRVWVNAILGSQFADVPATKSLDQVTKLEEDRIVGYYGAGTLYATPARQEPLL